MHIVNTSKLHYTEHAINKQNSNNAIYTCIFIWSILYGFGTFSLLSISAFILLSVSSFSFLSITSFHLQSIITSFSLLIITFLNTITTTFVSCLPSITFRNTITATFLSLGDFHMIHHQMYFHSYSLHTQPQALYSSVDGVLLGLKLYRQSHRIQKNHSCFQKSYQVLN